MSQTIYAPREQWPQWLQDAKTENAQVEITPSGRVIWCDGEFLGGAFRGDKFLGGAFRGGEFGGGAFWGAEFLGGAFRGGEFWDGAFWGDEFRGGEFWGGAFLGGAFLGGKWFGGDWLGGEWHIDAPIPMLTISPIGSRDAPLRAKREPDGSVTVCTGCFEGPLDAFEAAVRETHGDNQYAQEYLAAIALIRARYARQ